MDSVLHTRRGAQKTKVRAGTQLKTNLRKKMANIFVDKTGPPMVPPWIMTVNIESEN